MKKTLLLSLALLLTCSFSLSAQKDVYTSTYIATAMKTQSGDWSEYSEWAEDETKISFNLSDGGIFVYTEDYEFDDYYEIYDSEDEITDEEGDLVTVYYCMDESFGDWTIKLVKRYSLETFRTEVYITGEDRSYVYIVEKNTD
jgi:hypothetical protein